RERDRDAVAARRRAGDRHADVVQRLVLLHELERVGDVVRGERLAIAPLDAVTQLERDGLAIRAPREALGEPRVLRTRLEVVELHQWFVEQREGVLALAGAGRRERIERLREARLGVVLDNERLAGGATLGAPTAARGARRGAEGDDAHDGQPGNR